LRLPAAADWSAGGSDQQTGATGLRLQQPQEQYFLTRELHVLDCGIYRVISRRGSQSDDDANSLANQSMLEEERLREFSFNRGGSRLENG
ncbi:Hermansky-Pudlak syndrome 5 protein homolog, partial [Carassius auratus]|uniref:Hermansky-Pudlak syndrome 5 protein homolog n=1 Tax=Carassius auratus TaxID=7957 RepID=A0A6P6NCH0_CARAU